MECNELLNVAGYAGKIVLESGAEVYRCEETMVKIAQSFDVDEVQAFVMTTGIMLSITHKQQNYTKILRIQKRGVDLHKIDAINELSRTIKSKQYEIYEVMDILTKLDQEPRYSLPVTLFFSALSAFGFALFFQGSITDALCAFVIGICIKLSIVGMERNNINAFFQNAVSAGVGAFITLLCVLLSLCDSMDTVMISSIMLLVPGLAITNAIRDTVAGDYVSGLSRGAEAFLTAVAIAVGIGTVLAVWIKAVGGI